MFEALMLMIAFATLMLVVAKSKVSRSLED